MQYHSHWSLPRFGILYQNGTLPSCHRTLHHWWFCHVFHGGIRPFSALSEIRRRIRKHIHWVWWGQTHWLAMGCQESWAEALVLIIRITGGNEEHSWWTKRYWKAVRNWIIYDSKDYSAYSWDILQPIKRLQDKFPLQAHNTRAIYSIDKARLRNRLNHDATRKLVIETLYDEKNDDYFKKSW